MPRREQVATSLAGVALVEARSGASVELASLLGVQVLSAIRHRY